MSGAAPTHGRLVLPTSLLVMHVEQVHADTLTWLAGASEGAVVVDARAVTEVDGAGLQLLLSLGRTLRHQGRDARVEGASDHLLAMAASLGLRDGTQLCGLDLQREGHSAGLASGACGATESTGVCA